MSRHDPSVSVIIVNWNRLRDTLAAIDSVQRLQEMPLEIIVIDNGSSDGSAEALAGLEGIRLIRLDANVGPARARNIAIAAASGRYLFFLDSDAQVSDAGLARLVARMDSDPKIGVIGCSVLDPETRMLDQWIYAESAHTHASREFETYSFSAAGAMLRTDAVRQVGGFWDELVIYNEELDLSIRILRAGYRILYSPDGSVLHRSSQRGSKHFQKYYYYQIRNYIMISGRYFPWPARWWKIGLYAAIYLIKGTLSGQPTACLAGIRDGLRKIPTANFSRPRMTFAEFRRLESLNRRRSLRMPQ